MLKKISVLMVSFIAAIILIPYASASAAPELTVSAKAGLEGKSKYGKGAPLTITVENKGTAFTGDIVLDLATSHQSGNGVAIPLSIGSGETKTFSTIIPKSTDNYVMQGNALAKNIFFYEGGWEKGKEISHQGTQQYTTTMHSDDVNFILPLTTNADRLNALKSIQVQGWPNGQELLGTLKDPEAFPEDQKGLESVNYIIVDEYPISDLSQTRQQALLEWVRSGGTIIFGGSDNVNAEAGIFAKHLPLSLHSMQEIDASVFKNWAQTEDFDGKITTYETKLLGESKTVLESDGNVLIAYQPVGEGFVIQTAFSVGDEPLAKMGGMKAFWSILFEKLNLLYPTPQVFKGNPMDAITYGLGGVNEIFPSFKVSTPLIFGIIIFYIILIVPVLYFVLKRKDKREHAWWIIPIIAVLTSFCIFAYGAKDRIGQAQVQHTAVLNVQDNGNLHGYFAESMLSNKSGDFTFKASPETTMFSFSSSNFLGTPTSPLHTKALLENDANGTKMHMRHVGYWNVASLYGETTISDIGKFGMNLLLSNKKLSGTITNEFPFALTDVAIWSGSTLIPLGNLGPGETANIEKTLKSSTLLPRRSIYNNTIGSTVGKSDDILSMREESLLNFSGDIMNAKLEPVLIGYSDAQIIPIELENMKSNLSSKTLLVQPVEVEIEFSDAVTVDADMMSMTLLSENGMIEADSYGDVSGMYYFNEAVYNQTWKLPEQLKDKNMKWTSLEVSKIQDNIYQTSILNQATNEYEKIDKGTSKITENSHDYVTADGEIIIRIQFHDSRNGNEGRAPALELVGEVAR